ncbi:unnamed protein product [Rangifer tarandus platyrhynchus]|uniref:Uncharacterized protein n=1 Tax=Rangifer tarandus platyrhynchus TaxID=3082113 RepID=A0ABN8Y199_RANTA|nr:unnamed protein product [Rangifer tarandus platyrhynchus]
MSWSSPHFQDLAAHFQLARSAETGASPPGTAASAGVPCPRLRFLNSPSWNPANKRCFPRREDSKNEPLLPAAPPSNFINYSQLTGMQATGSLQGGQLSGCAEPRWPRTAPAAAAAGAGRGAAVLHQPPGLRGARSPAIAGAHRLAAAATTKATRFRVVPSAAAAARPGVRRSEPLVRVSGSEGIVALQERQQGKSRGAAAGSAASPLPSSRSHRGRAGKRAGEQAPQFALAAAPRRMTSSEAVQPCGARDATAHEPGWLRHVTGGRDGGGAGRGGGGTRRGRDEEGRGGGEPGGAGWEQEAQLPRGKVPEVSRLGFCEPKAVVVELVCPQSPLSLKN